MIGWVLAAAAEPPVYTGEHFSFGEAAEVAAEPWWTTYDDPLLVELVEEGIRANPDLSAAIARVQQASGAYWQTRSLLVPTVSFDVSTTHQPVNPQTFVPPDVGDAKTQNVLQLVLRGGYELDVFGRNTLGMQASRFDRLAAEGDRDATALAVALQVASAYFDLAAARMRAQVLQRQLATNRDLLTVVELQREATAASTVDVLQQRQQVAALEAILPAAEASVDLTAYRLAVLLGRPSVTGPIETRGLPATGALPGVGTPADLLDHRPDLRAARRRADAARARESAALMGFFPTLRVDGQVGYFSFWWGSQTPALRQAYQVSTLLSVPLFAGGRRHGALATAKGTTYAASEGYRGATLRALQEVEGAHLQDRAAQARLVAFVASEQLARAAYERAREQWLEGVASYLTVFTNLGAWQRAELDLVDARRFAVGARIQLQEALGGTWTRDLGHRSTR